MFVTFFLDSSKIATHKLELIHCLNSISIHSSYFDKTYICITNKTFFLNCKYQFLKGKIWITDFLTIDSNREKLKRNYKC
jgi:hypothetical protein